MSIDGVKSDPEIQVNSLSSLFHNRLDFIRVELKILQYFQVKKLSTRF